MSPKLKNIIIFVVIFIVAVVVYNFFFAKEKETAFLVTTTPLGVTPIGDISTPSEIGQEFLATLLNIRTLKLDNSIFLSNEFNTLRDFSVPLTIPEEVGRPNPFAPLGEEVQLTEEPVATIPTTDITATSAVLNGSVAPNLIEVQKGFEWGIDESLGNATSTAIDATQTGFFSHQLTGLTPATTYYFRALVIVGVEVVTAEILTFTTTE